MVAIKSTLAVIGLAALAAASPISKDPKDTTNRVTVKHVMQLIAKEYPGLTRDQQREVKKRLETCANGFKKAKADKAPRKKLNDMAAKCLSELHNDMQTKKKPTLETKLAAATLEAEDLQEIEEALLEDFSFIIGDTYGDAPPSKDESSPKSKEPAPSLASAIVPAVKGLADSIIKTVLGTVNKVLHPKTWALLPQLKNPKNKAVLDRLNECYGGAVKIEFHGNKVIANANDGNKLTITDPKQVKKVEKSPRSIPTNLELQAKCLAEAQQSLKGKGAKAPTPEQIAEFVQELSQN
ncbi:hypothetical protein EsH8_IV_000435 [Colletotrichum jinshuiense]